MSTKIRESEAERNKALYRDNRAEIAEAYKEAGSWGGALRALVQLEPDSDEEGAEMAKAIKENKAKGEKALPDYFIKSIYEHKYEGPSEWTDADFWAAFIDAVEESKGSLIADAKELQEIAEVTECGLEEINKWLVLGRECKYLNALTAALEGGEKYAALLKIEPSAFNLPKEWDSPGPDPERLNKERAIAKAICWRYWLHEFKYARPSPREVAETSGAPYPLILEAVGEFHKYGF